VNVLSLCYLIIQATDKDLRQ